MHKVPLDVNLIFLFTGALILVLAPWMIWDVLMNRGEGIQDIHSITLCAAGFIHHYAGRIIRRGRDE